MAGLRGALLLAVIAAVSGFRTRHRHAESNVATLNATSMNSRNIKIGREHEYHVYWPTTQQTTCSAIMFSVGTAMGSDQYSDFAAGVVAKGYIVIIVDPESGSLTKLNKEKLQAAFLAGKEGVAEWTSNACGTINAWVMGGHSAGGGTAHKVFQDMPQITDGIFSVDPYPGDDWGPAVDLPGLYWGFSESTCAVPIEDSAQAAYARTATDKRVFAKVKVVQQGWLRPSYYHCSISNGCGIVCFSFGGTPASFFVDVANSIETFVLSLTSRQWGPTLRDNIKALPKSTPLDWYINEDPL